MRCSEARGLRSGIIRQLWFASLLLVGSPAPSLTIVPFDIEDLVSWSELVALVEVTDSEIVEGRFRVKVLVVDSILGHAPEELAFSALALGPDFPRLSVGRRYLVFLNLSNRIERILGWQWGVFEERGGLLFNFDGSPLSEGDSRLGSAGEGDGHIGHSAPGAQQLDFGDLRTQILAAREALSGRGVRLPSADAVVESEVW